MRNIQIPVEDIIVKKRIRRDMGDMQSLAESMKRFGQISPILISKNRVLIAGGRRLEAARLLGWRTISAMVAEMPAADTASLEYEVEENLQRRDFTPDELIQATREIYRLKHPGFFRRIGNAIARLFRRLFKIPG
jgi:ParB family chromosome partitioning protein